MTPEELQIAQSILTSIQNTTSYSYETLVEGTAINATLDTIAIIFSLIASLGLAYIARKETFKNRAENKYDASDLPGPIAMPCIVFAVAFILILIITSLITSTMMGFIVPEYVVMNRISESMIQ